jgi:hypothetical protein
MKGFIKKTLLYFVLLLGYILLYVIDIEEFIYPSEDTKVESKVDFVYQQF